jgi:phosphoribosylformylglycinamidine synthase
MLFGEVDLGLSLLLDSRGPSDRLDSLLFGESQGRVLVSVSAERQASILHAAEESGLAAQALGSTDESGRFKISIAGDEIFDAAVPSLRESWSQAIPNYMK